jgi:hypothetical protein
MFFFEKKNQKTFTNWSSLHPERPKPEQARVFGFCFLKKQPFLSFSDVVKA